MATVPCHKLLFFLFKLTLIEYALAPTPLSSIGGIWGLEEGHAAAVSDVTVCSHLIFVDI